MTKYLIYGLVDPMTHQLRYIGKSERGLLRPAQHSMDSYLKRDQTHKGNWVRNLVATGLRPSVVVIQELPDKDILPEAEAFWIAYFKTMSCPLTNHCQGGLGFTGKHTEETKKKISMARLGRRASDETKKKMSAVMMGHKYALGHRASDETRKKMSAAQMGRKTSEDARAKLSAAGLGNKNTLGYRHTAQSRAKMSAAKLGNKNCLGHKASEKAKRNMSAAARRRKKK